MNASHPRVSVAMTTYNGSLYLREQLDSLYSQTLKPYEVVVVDDNSQDGTSGILEEYRIKYGLQYYINDTNLGVNKNFEKALQQCSGEYVIFCDQDDIWFPTKIESTLTTMLQIENGQPAIVSSKCIDVDSNLNILREYRYEDSSRMVDTVIGRGNSQGCSLMLNRNLINILKPFPDTKPLYDVYVSLIAAFTGIKYNKGEKLMYYRHHENNVLAKINNEVKIKSNIGKYVINHIRDRIGNILIPSERFESIKLVSEEYSDYIRDDSKKLIKDILSFKNYGKIRKIQMLLRIPGLNAYKRITDCIFTILS